MDMNIQSNSTIRTFPQTMTCVVENGNIIHVDYLGNKKVIGVTTETYNELEKISTEYYNKLVELGVIVPPKTPEQIQQEQMQMMAAMMEQMKQMQAEMEVLRNAQSTNVSANAENESSTTKQIDVSMATSPADVSQCNKPTAST